MQCPRCGQWNRSTFQTCFQCGEPLQEHETQIDKEISWQDEINTNFRAEVYVTVDEDGREQGEQMHPGDAFANKVSQQNVDRKQKDDRIRDFQNKYHTKEEMFRPQKRKIVHTYYEAQQDSKENQYQQTFQTQSDVDMGQRNVKYDDYAYANSHENPLQKSKKKALRRKKIRRKHHWFNWLIVLILLCLIGFFGYKGYQEIIVPWQEKQRIAEKENDQQEYDIESSMLDGVSAHVIKIKGPENAQIYIKELRKSFTVIGGVARIEVYDHIWYQHEESLEKEKYDVTMTPFLQTSSGKQQPLELINFYVDIPESPFDLISPDTTEVEVDNRAKYQIQFRVEKGSTVSINGLDYSDLVNTQDGLVSYNANVIPGTTVVTVTTKTSHYRPRTVKYTLKRQKQSIPIELDSTLGTTWHSSKPMPVKGSTLPNGATITVVSPHEALDVSQLDSHGIFSFNAIFPYIGTNTIEIKVSHPEREDTTIKYDVYHVSPAAVYTKNAWPMKPYDYAEYLNNVALRVKKSQVYKCVGEIVEIISDQPQLAIMEMGDAENPRRVLLENKTKNMWKLGESLRIYADAFGVYNGIPRLTARYTYFD